MKLFDKTKTIWWFLPLLIGLGIRMILMPITLHPDLWGHSFTAYFFAYEGRLDIYDYLLSLPKTHPLVANFGVTDIFIYPPLTYFTLGIFRLLVKPIADPNFIPWLLSNLGDVHNYSGLSSQLFLFKLPYLFVDIAVAFLLSGLFNEPNKKKTAFILWMFNPITIYATFMIGQLDILPVLFLVMSMYFVKKDKPVPALISLGIGGAYKMFPLLFIPVLAFVLANNFKDKIKYLLIGIAPFFLTIAPYLTSSAFRSMVLFSPKSQKMLFMGWPVSGAEVIYPFVILLFLAYWLAYYRAKTIPVFWYFLFILLSIFSVTHFHPQWFLWVTPLLIWILIKENFKNLLLVITLLSCWLLITLFFDSSLTWGLFNPVWPQLDKTIGLTEFVGKYTDVFQIKSIVRSIFAATSIVLVYLTLVTKHEEAK